ncbi:MAG: FKBP-type peptidyl-prolyl cis-trans isomerase [Bacteroidota bacterium]
MQIKQLVAVLLITGFSVMGLHGQKLESKLDSMSYALGLNLGKSFKQLDLDMNSDLIFKGIKDVLDGNELQVSELDVRKWMSALQREAQANQARAQAAENEARFAQVREESVKFLEENKEKPGVMTTPSGLQYKVLREGTGAKPASASTKVKVHYEGRLIDGTVFDSSYERGQPIEFSLNGVIPGWTEGLQLMNVGSKYQLYIPQNLGYGSRGGGPKIPPFSALVFDVELLDIVE